jgi:rRNA maturation endonuclease Nob1
MLTDSEAQVLSPYIIEDESYYAWNEGAEAVRDHYENLITQGRLRAVGYVEAIEMDDRFLRVVYPWRCSGCRSGLVADKGFCHVCGNQLQAQNA